MKFSLIGVCRQSTGTIDGNWIQNHVGTLETATAEAIATEKANSNRIDVAVVAEVSGMGTGHMEYFLKRLDTQRNGAKNETQSTQ